MEHFLGFYNSENSFNLEKHDLDVCNSKKLNNQNGILILRDQNAPKASYHCQNEIEAIILGHPRWRNSDSQKIAEKKGNAEALINQYLTSGIDLHDYLSGDFSLAIIDHNKNRVILSIDRLGIMPLYFSPAKQGGILFSTKLSLLTQHPDVLTGANNQSIYNYIYFHAIPSPDTFYSGISKLEPAHFVVCENGKINSKPYWYPTFNDENTGTIESYADKLVETMDAAIKRCDAEENIGAFLSGGLDSSTVVGLLSKYHGEDTQAYSIGFDEEGYDEMAFAEIAAKHFKTKLNKYYVTPEDVESTIELIASAYDEPFGNSSAIPAFFCAKLAYENGTRVMLAGDGGDELFAGNTRYAKQKIFEHYSKVPSALRSLLIEPLANSSIANISKPTRKIKSYISQAKIPLPDRLETYNFLHHFNPKDVFDTDFFDSIDTNYPLELKRKTYHTAPSSSSLNKMLYLDWKFTLADNDLRKVNQMCELNGIDVRYPFLDDELVAFSAQIPPHLKLQGNNLRYFYKQALKDFLPGEIINKSKHGFGLPFGEWLQTSPSLQHLIYDHLSALKKRNIIKPEFIDNLIKTHQTDHASYYGTMVWILAMMEIWFNKNNT